LLNGDLSLRTALFRTEKTNERNTDPALSDIYILSGRRHTDGIEVEAAGRITRKWEMFGALALMSAKIDKQLNPYGVGLTPVNTPTFTGNLWTTYRILPDWKIGGGADFVGDREGYSIGTTTPYTPPIVRHIPGYVRFDAMAEWDVTKSYAVKFNVFNLLNQRYYDSIYTNGGHAIPGVDRTVQVSLSYKF
jgi:catecholate siderophore receptor